MEHRIILSVKGVDHTGVQECCVCGNEAHYRVIMGQPVQKFTVVEFYCEPHYSEELFVQLHSQ